MKILFIAPLPPPIHGHSVASLTLYNSLKIENEVLLVDLGKDSLVNGFNGIKRFFKILRVFWNIFLNVRHADVVYLTISESLFGNLKDLFIYILCFRKRSSLFIHLHGGSIKELLWDKNWLLFKFNRFFIERIGGIIILGESHRSIFNSFVDNSRIHVVANFAHKSLFLEEHLIIEKFTQNGPINLLFLSNLLPEKGYLELLRSLSMLPYELENNIFLHFAGAFGSVEEKDNFLSLIEGKDNIFYHGVVDMEVKSSLLAKAHLFCLPTSYLEGQPISILEAYASGCVVLTTSSGGIKDMFIQNINGYVITGRSEVLISETIVKSFTNRCDWLDIAIRNSTLAKQKYRDEAFISSLKSILQSK